MKPDDSKLLAYVDGELGAAESTMIERALAASPELAESVDLLRASRLPYREAFAAQKLPPVPPDLQRKIQELASAAGSRRVDQTDVPPAAPTDVTPGIRAVELPPSAPVRTRPRNAPLWLAAAFVAGAFCTGIVLRLAPGFVPTSPSGAGNTTLAATDASPWVKAAVGYQQLYTRDTVEDVTPDLSAAAKTVNAIRHVDGLDLRVPDLHAAGLSFKGIARLRFQGKPLVQIVYLPKTGAPIALCVMKDMRPDKTIAQQRVDGMNVVSWRKNELKYALIGAPGSTDLDAIAKQILSDSADAMFASAAVPVVHAAG